MFIQQINSLNNIFPFTVKPITPYNLTVEYENGTYIFEWKSGYENHEYRSALPFRSILAYQQVGQPMKVSLSTAQKNKNKIRKTHLYFAIYLQINVWQPGKTHKDIIAAEF